MNAYTHYMTMTSIHMHVCTEHLHAISIQYNHDSFACIHTYIVHGYNYNVHVYYTTHLAFACAVYCKST